MNLNLSQLREKISIPLPTIFSSKRRKSSVRKSRRKIYYFLYGLLVFSMFFACNYLSSSIEPLIRAELQKQNQYNFEIERINPSVFPPRVELKGVEIKEKRSGKRLVQFNSLDMSLNLFSLFKSRLGIDFSAGIYGAVVKGVVSSGSFFDLKNFYADIACQNISLAAIPYIDKLDLGLKGLGSITADVKGTTADPASYRGTVEIDIQSPAFKGVPPLFIVPEVKMDSLKASADLENMKLNVNSLELAGQQASGALKGSVTINPKNINNSKLDLKGQVKVDVRLLNTRIIVQKKALALLKAKKSIAIEISDTIGSPWVSFAK
ncbi:type II secretion system protein GspN [Maridesulfovibrio bastinii]|uniref:type II secretion system protein GspN n=1 Tax=Maridesulfovibrio bastinii TaxID=47157 RepID=UPI00041CCC83|nr:type II secretion system protein GspN [Maridesulfovibrio bastinii]